MNHPSLKIVKASAGSGKTFTLALQYLLLVFADPKNYQKILAVTFTNKATNEMKQRILSVLRDLTKPENLAIYNPYREKILEIFTYKTPEILQIEADAIYREMMHHYQRFSVSTIDGFMQKVIRSFAFELGLDSQFALELNTQKVLKTLQEDLDAVLPKKPKLLDFLLQLIYSSVSAGKSYQYQRITEDYFKEIFKERYAEFEQILLKFESPETLNEVLENLRNISSEIIQQFEDKMDLFAEQANEIFDKHENIQQILKYKSRSPLLKLPNVGSAVLNESLFKYLTDDDAWFQDGNYNELFKKEITQILTEVKQFSDAHLSDYILSGKLQDNFVFVSLMQEMTLLLRDFRNDSKRILISDTQKILHGILGSDSNPAFVWEKMGQQFQYFLFDEFQDTSNQQWSGFKPLLENVLSDTPASRIPHHLIVGDVKQAIYRWRSGNWEILHNEAERAFKPFAKVDTLQDNHRSAKNIINFNNELFKKLPKTLQEFVNNSLLSYAPEVQEWWKNKGYHQIIEKVYENANQLFPTDASVEKQGGTVKISVIPKAKNTDENYDEDDKIQANSNIINQMIEEIKILQNERNYALSDIAILVRRNGEAQKVVNALLNANLAVISGDALLLAQNDTIKFIINILNALFATPQNQTLYWAEAAWLYCKIHHLSFSPNHWPMFKNGEFIKQQIIFPKNFYTQIDRWKNYGSLSLLEEIILVFELEKNAENQLYLLKLRDIFDQQNQFGDQGIPAFLYWWQTEGFETNLPALNNINAIQVITIHKSKGLDFRAVMLPYCDWSVKPSSKNMIFANLGNSPFKTLGKIPVKYNEDLCQTPVIYDVLEEKVQTTMEALNILYVATTRCIDYLHLYIDKKDSYRDFTRIGHAIINAWGTTEVEGKDNRKKEEFILTDGLLVDKFIPIEKIEPLKDTEFYHQTKKKITTQLDAILFQKENFIQKNVALNIDFGTEGKIMHDILSQCNRIEELAEAVSQTQTKYLFPDVEIVKWTQQAEQILNHPEVKILFEKGEILSEKSLINEHGQIFRPDKVILTPQNSAIVLDYKFTQKQENSHIEQVKTYRNLLQKMGYENVTAYLYYEKTNTLQLIEA